MSIAFEVSLREGAVYIFWVLHSKGKIYCACYLAKRLMHAIRKEDRRHPASESCAACSYERSD